MARGTSTYEQPPRPPDEIVAATDRPPRRVPIPLIREPEPEPEPQPEPGRPLGSHPSVRLKEDR